MLYRKARKEHEEALRALAFENERLKREQEAKELEELRNKLQVCQ